MKRERNVDKESGMAQDQCPQCNRFLPYDDSKHYYHCAVKCESADEWDMHPVAAFCSQRCADKFHD